MENMVFLRGIGIWGLGCGFSMWVFLWVFWWFHLVGIGVGIFGGLGFEV